MIVLLMGVSGSGKTTIGTLLAEKAGAVFADADDYHSAANKQKMGAGHPLDDNDRQPWLLTLNELMRGWYAQHKSGVLACSALKERYRTTLKAGMPEGTVHFVMLEGSAEMIGERMTARKHEYMTPALLQSQFAALEVPRDAVIVGNDRPPDEVVAEILARIDAANTKASM